MVTKIHLITSLNFFANWRINFDQILIDFGSFHGSGLKWTVLGQSGRSRGVKLDGPNDWKWTVLGQSGRSKRLKVDGLRKWTVLKSKSGRSKGKWPYDLKYWIWTVSRDKSGRSKGMKLDDLKESKWTVSRAKKEIRVKLGFGWN